MILDVIRFCDQNYNRNIGARYMLLIRNFLVRCNQNIKFIPDQREKLAVTYTIPPYVAGNQDYMILPQMLPQLSGD